VAESTVHGRAPCKTRVRAELFLVLPDPGLELGVELEPAAVPVPVPDPVPLLATVTWPAISVDEKREVCKQIQTQVGLRRTLLERRQGIVGLLVRLRLVERDTDGDKVLAYMSALFRGKRKRGYRTEKDALSCGYHLIASDIVKLFSSCVSMIPPAVEVASSQVVDEQLVVCIDVAEVMLAVPTRQSFESYFHMIVCKPSALAIARIRSCTRKNNMSVSCWR
jgi:hypothetical protein